MMRKYPLILIVFLACAPQPAPAQTFHKWQLAQIEKVIHAFNSGNIDRISSVVDFPLGMPYPLEPISGPADLRRRFQEVFDKKFIERVATSEPSKDWRDMGWRGIMFGNGDIWLDDDGKIITINYTTAVERKALKNAIERDKLTLQPSMRHFTKPILYWETRSYRIRIDQLANGDYRYASWRKGESMKQTPSLVISNGVMQFDGEANYQYVFHHAGYRYVCYITVIGTAKQAPGYLDVYKGRKLVLEQGVITFD